MLKKFWNYQKLLSFSTNPTNAKEPFKLPYFSIFIFMLIIVTLNQILNINMIIFMPIILTLYSAYSIINSQNKLYEIIPVSKLYSLISIYLLVLVNILYILIMTTIAISLFTIPAAIGIIYVLNLFTAGRIIGIPLKDLMAQFISTLNISLLSNNWKPLLVTVCIFTITACILIPIFFIKLKSLRKKLIISVIVIVPIVLLFFKTTLPLVPELKKVHFWKSITIMPHYNEFILILLYVCLVIIPISMLISYRLYNGKRCLTC